MTNTTEKLMTSVFPKKTWFLGISSDLPENIISRIKDFNPKFIDALVLTNGDVWRYGGNYRLQNFLSGLGFPVFIITPGYENKKIVENVFEISWPSCYFSRSVSKGKPEIKNKSLPWGFSSLNNKCNLHRLILGYRLFQNNLIDKIIFSQNTVDLENIVGFHRNMLDQFPDFKQYESLLPIRTVERLANQSLLHSSTINYNNDHTIDHDAYENSYFNIVTESEVETFYWPGVSVDNPVITEKSYKPLLSAQIPIYLAPKGHINHLRSLGFETFDDIFPENYDFFGLYQKVETIVLMVSRGKEWAEYAYQDHRREIKHNLDLIYSDKIERIVISNIKKYVENACNQQDFCS